MRCKAHSAAWSHTSPQPSSRRHVKRLHLSRSQYVRFHPHVLLGTEPPRSYTVTAILISDETVVLQSVPGLCVSPLQYPIPNRKSPKCPVFKGFRFRQGLHTLFYRCYVNHFFRQRRVLHLLRNSARSNRPAALFRICQTKNPLLFEYPFRSLLRM